MYRMSWPVLQTGRPVGYTNIIRMANTDERNQGGQGGNQGQGQGGQRKNPGTPGSNQDNEGGGSTQKRQNRDSVSIDEE